jgi:hypothetical protein
MFASLRYGAFAAIFVCGLCYSPTPAWSQGGGGGGGGGPGPTRPATEPAEGSNQPRTTPSQSPSAPESPADSKSRLQQGEQRSQPGAATNR